MHDFNLQMSKALDLEESIKKDIEQAVRKRCSCDFNSSEIYSGEFSCQTTTTEVVYRAIINGSSELLRATELVTFMESWLRDEGTLLYNKFRLRLVQSCSLHIESFNEAECKGDGGTDERETNSMSNEGLLLGSSACYRFQSCISGLDGDDNLKDGGSAEI